MQHLSTQIPSIDRAVDLHTGNLYLNSTLYIIDATWEWDLNCEAIFCSDVILPADPEFIGTRGIFYPDDVVAVKNFLDALNQGQSSSVRFRMITTYGEVKSIKAENARIRIDEENTIEIDLPFQVLLNTYKELEQEKNADKALLLKQMLEQFEKLNKAGSWYVNSVTGETVYSDQMFRIFEMMPGSLNPHLQTFIPFIHHEDKEEVSNAVDTSFAGRVPLHIEYRIISSSGKIKRLLHIAEWNHNYKGELTQIGLLKDISSEFQQEQQLESTSNDLLFYRQMLHLHERSSGSGFWYMNLLTKQSYFSDNYYKILGLKPQSIPASVGMITNYVHPDDRQMVQDALHKMRSMQIAPELEFRMIRTDGRVRYISQKAKLIIYGSDELIMSVIVNDVTDVKQLQKKVADREEIVHIKDFIHLQTEQLAGIGSWTWDIDLDKIDCSENMCRMLGHKRKTHIEFNQIVRGIHPDDRKKFLEEINVAVETDSATGFNFRMLTAGEIKQIKGYFKRLDYEGRKLMIGTMQEVTQEHSRQKQLHQSLQVSQMLAENLLDAIFMTDAENNFLLWNKGAQILFGMQEEEIIGKNFFEKFPDQRFDGRIRQFNRALAGEKTLESAIRIVPKKLHNIIMIPLQGEDDEVIGILHILQDVTAEVNMRTTLSERVAFIEKLLEQTVDRIIVLDKNFNYKYWNRKAEQHYHINSEYITGKNLLDVFPNIVEEPVYQDLKKVLKGERIYLPATRDNTAAEFEETYLVPLTDEKQEVTGILWVIHDLTKDVALEQQSKKAAEILNFLNENFIELDKEEKISFVNNQAEQFLMRKREEILGKTLWELFPDFEHSELFEDLKKHIRSGDLLRKEFLSPFSNRYVMLSVAPTIDGTIIAFFDVQFLKDAENDLKRVNDELRLKNSIYNYAEEIAMLGTWTWAPETDEANYSDNMFRLLGMKPQSINPDFENIPKLIHPEDRPRVLAIAEELRKGNASQEVEYRLTRTDGVQRIFRNRVQLINRDGNNYVIGTTQDITEQKLVEQELEKQHSRLNEAQELSHIGSFEHDLVTNEILWSDEMFRIYGLTPQSTKITLELVFSYIHPDDVEEFSETLKDVHESQVNKIITHRIIRQDGVTRMVNRHFQSVADESGNIVLVTGTVHDITEVYERELAEKTAEILLRKKDEFIGMASHELKTPITTLSLSLELLKSSVESLPDPGPLEHVVNTSMRQVNKLNDLVNELRDLALIQAGKMQVRKESFNICESISACVTDLEESLKQVELSIDCSPQIMLYADRSRIEQVITNLITNAIKYSTSPKEIQINVLTSNKFAKISVTDNGVGISEENKEKLFERYYRIQETAVNIQGQGLGLYISKQIVKKHQGEIGVESEAGKGSTFWFTIPAKV